MTFPLLDIEFRNEVAEPVANIFGQGHYVVGCDEHTEQDRADERHYFPAGALDDEEYA
jgi:hypothetical protein